MLHPSPTSPMTLALKLAAEAGEAGEAPVGAVIVENGDILAAERNRMQALNDPTAHAEMLAIRAALAKRGTGRLDGCDLYVTLEPCAMCVGAIFHARIGRLVYGAPDPKTGACGSVINLPGEERLNHHMQVTRDVLAAECANMLRQFFVGRRMGVKADRG
jgi:tRNA(adenine34) deaminase